MKTQINLTKYLELKSTFGFKKLDFLLNDISSGELIIALKKENSNKQLQIIFDGELSNYKFIKESFDYGNTYTLPQEYKDFPILIIENCETANLISKNTFEFYEAKQFKSYLIITNNEFIEVVSLYEPKIEYDNVIKIRYND